MVIGLDKFKEYFRKYPDNYIIIGGTACDIILSKVGFTPRTTKDIDIILIVEALSKEFVAQFWHFIREGDYERKEQSEEQRKYYRFSNPRNNAFPKQIELFSRTPDSIQPDAITRYTPIPTDDDLSSLSAILLDENYYTFLRTHCTEQDGLQRANIEALICLKAKAYSDMLQRKEAGASIDSRNINKHKADVFRLVVTLTPENSFVVPEAIKADLAAFMQQIKDDLPNEEMFKNMGLPHTSPQDVYKQLLQTFNLQEAS